MAYDKLSSFKTTIATRNGKTAITYHSTPIVEFDSETITLRSGGYETVTTKKKMNQAANQFGLKYAVFQRKGKWYVTHETTWAPGSEVEFYDGMTISR